MRTSRITALAAMLMLATAAAQADDHMFLLDASITCCSSGQHVFGWLDASSAGQDPADIPEPPTPPGRHLAAAFRIPGVTDPELWRRDLRAATDFEGDGRETWELAISTGEAPTTCTVTITPDLGSASGLRVIFSGAYQDTTTIPTSISFPLDHQAQLFIELATDAVAVEPMTWGGVKSLYE